MHNSAQAISPQRGPVHGEGAELHIQGVVQGVGFRPFVYRLALQEGICGSVRNSGQGVVILAWAKKEALETFVRRLREEAPPLARIDRILYRSASREQPAEGFTIATSSAGGGAATLISPDTATCPDCLAEILDPADRRFDYPFTNCTNCGPRLTIIRRIPYDRPHTSMASFTMCRKCEAEYHDPADRRFHAQPNGCPTCGPHLAWHGADGTLLDRERCLDLAAKALAKGKVVAIRGLGGFHLAVDATSPEAVERLRLRKHRHHKPLAIMAADLEAAHQVARISPLEKALLTGPQRPIVLLRRQGDLLAPLIAPGLDEIGVMLPYTPLHHLLFRRPDCPRWLVMTSGNLSEEPICIHNREAISRLAGIADFFLLHNREIVTRVDDSVVRAARGNIQMIRRSRGYVPLPVALPADATGLLGCGAELKNTFCLGRGREGFAGQHIGDLQHPTTLAFFEESVEIFRRLLEVKITGLACDLHPDYLSSRYARSLDLPLVRVQHHHAHGAAIMAEHGLEKALAVVFDGTGLGPDGTVWGGEILAIDQQGFRRLACLRQAPLPGGDLAARQIWRMALALAWDAGLPPEYLELPIGSQERDILESMMAKGLNTPMTSSCGRLFDGVASLLGLRHEARYEAQAAMELETLARQAPPPPPGEERYPVAVRDEAPYLILDTRPMLRRLLADRREGRPIQRIGRDFHLWLAASATAALETLRARCGEDTVVLAGGCFQNRLLLDRLQDNLEARGFKVFTGHQVPVNDGSIALGQVMVAAWMHSKRR